MADEICYDRGVMLSMLKSLPVLLLLLYVLLSDQTQQGFSSPESLSTPPSVLL